MRRSSLLAVSQARFAFQIGKFDTRLRKIWKVYANSDVGPRIRLLLPLQAMLLSPIGAARLLADAEVATRAVVEVAVVVDAVVDTEECYHGCSG